MANRELNKERVLQAYSLALNDPAYQRDDEARLKLFRKVLIDNKLETVADLQAYREGLQESVAKLTAARQDLRNALKRAERAEDEPAKRNCAAQIKQVSTSLRKVRKEVKLCDEIEERSMQVSEKLRQTREESNRDMSQDQINPSVRSATSPR